jgi:hypothetical protein
MVALFQSGQMLDIRQVFEPAARFLVYFEMLQANQTYFHTV